MLKTSKFLLAAEDELGIAVGTRLLTQYGNGLEIFRVYNGRGFGQLKNNVSKYQRMAKNGFPVLLLVDLDNASCPSVFLNDWLNGQAVSENFLFRICVREVESWLLADKINLAAFLHIKPKSMTDEPEKISDPKSTLIRVAQKSPKQIRNGITPHKNAKIGPLYNELLCAFIKKQWNPEVARKKSSSLDKAIKKITAFPLHSLSVY